MIVILRTIVFQNQVLKNSGQHQTIHVFGLDHVIFCELI